MNVSHTMQMEWMTASWNTCWVNCQDSPKPNSYSMYTSWNWDLNRFICSQYINTAFWQEFCWRGSETENLKQDRDIRRFERGAVDSKFGASEGEIKIYIDICISSSCGPRLNERVLTYKLVGCDSLTFTAPGFSYGYLDLTSKNAANFKAPTHTTRSPSNKGLDGVYEVFGSIVSFAPAYLRIAELIPPAVPIIPIEGLNRIPVRTLYVSINLCSKHWIGAQ